MNVFEENVNSSVVQFEEEEYRSNKWKNIAEEYECRT